MNPSTGSSISRQKPKSPGSDVSAEHYLRLLAHRKWMILAVFVGVTGAVIFVARLLPNIYTSAAVILVDPQKVPESYVKSTVTGDVRNRLSSLSNQILSGTQLQKIIEALNLYPEERKKLGREEVIAKMRKNIETSLLNDFAGNQDLQAFKVQFSGEDPRLVSQVANRLADAFIDGNIRNREQVANGTTEFLNNQLEQSRQELEAQEAKIRDFNLKHIGQTPDQESATVQVAGQLQAQIQLENEAMANAVQHRKDLEGMLTQSSAAVIEVDPPSVPAPAIGSAPGGQRGAAPVDPLAADTAQLNFLLTKYSATYPTVIQLKNKIAREAAQLKQKSTPTTVAVAVPDPAPPKSPTADGRLPQGSPAVAVAHYNPILQSQLREVDEEIAHHRDTLAQLTTQLHNYHTKLDAIPATKQELASLTRDYEISKAHYSQLLEGKMKADTAAQMEIRQKGEKLDLLDPAVPADRPTSPKRGMIDVGGAAAGLALGILAALGTEFLGMSVTDPNDIVEVAGVNVLGVIPVIMTRSDKAARRRKWIVAVASTTVMALAAGGVILFRMHNQV